MSLPQQRNRLFESPFLPAVDDADWETFNREREREHKKEHGNLTTFFPVSKDITEEKLKDVKKEMERIESNLRHRQSTTNQSPEPAPVGAEQETVVKERVVSCFC